MAKDKGNEKMMKEILDKLKFYKDEQNEETIYAEIEFEKHRELVDTRSKRFHAYLREYYKSESNDCNVPNYAPLLQEKCDQTLLWGKSIQPFHRIAGDEHTIVYFLANLTFDTVVVNENGWEIKAQNKYKFLKPKSMKPQANPESGGSLLDLLRPFINMDEPSFKLCTVHLIQCFFPRSSHFVSIISAPKGTGKSTFSALIRDIIDPSLIKHSVMPNSIDELKNHLANNPVVVFDNTRPLSDTESDIFCASTTETFMTKRTLYTTSDETILKLKNIILINGIDVVPKKSDLLERSLLFELKTISPSERLTEKAFWESFEKTKPFIIGAIFDTLAKAMQIKKSLVLTNTHRMGDAYTDMIAISLALGINEAEFIKIFNENKEILENISRRNNDFCNAINDFMDSIEKSKIQCTMGELFSAVRDSKVCEKSTLPSSPSAFSRKLNEERAELSKLGITYVIEVKKDASHITLLRTTK